MTQEQRPIEQTAEQADDRWAPWWVYLVVILGANYLRGAVMSEEEMPVWAIVLVVAGVSATLFVAVTAIHRARSRFGHSR